LVDRDAQLVEDLGLQLKYVINTHVHADHVTGTGKLKLKFPNVKSAISEASEAMADIKLKENDLLHFGDRYLRSIHTPGHTSARHFLFYLL
jgi:sulfur dioxygenase